MGNEENIYWNIRKGSQIGTLAESHVYGLNNARKRLNIIQHWAKNKDWVLYLVTENGQTPDDFNEEVE